MRLKLSLIELGMIVVIIGLLVTLMIPGGDYDHAHRYPPATPGSGANLAGVNGEYCMGDGLGMNWRLSILPDGRYSFVASGCTGVHHRESGHVRLTEGRYELSPSGPGAPELERSLVLIRWDRRRYLIPPGRMPAFRQAIVEGEEPRDRVHGSFYVGQPMEPADGLPDAPECWVNGLCEDLLVGRVLEVSAMGLAKIGRARVDLGADLGLRVGDMLTVQRRGMAPFRRLRVASVEDGSCLADECYPGASEHPLGRGQAVVAVRVKRGDGRR